jgi:hypothetical protein
LIAVEVPLHEPPVSLDPIDLLLAILVGGTVLTDERPHSIAAPFVEGEQVTSIRVFIAAAPSTPDYVAEGARRGRGSKV